VEDDGQVLLCVEISDLLAATEVSLTVSLEAVSLGKAGMKNELLSMLCATLLTKLGLKNRLRPAQNVLFVIEKYMKKLPSFMEVVFFLQRSNGCYV